MRREIDGFYVLYTAAAVKVAKGKQSPAFCCVLILADRGVAAQWGMGQKGIEMANLNDRTNAQGLGKHHLW
ncbi:hypothetical protein [Pseudomonas putida]|uniref:Uncharacterized protein n=1 Tax=Pseudomonas putida TaxID=303 RepID=A0A2C5W606_PSEPU|nr:hypothetical protein [Pseudomonas putida]PHH39341.1 hypothetical protein CRX57_03880 [Pseudomonas putida]